MSKNWLYFKYVARHKWFVLLEGLKLGVPLGQLLVHDLSKYGLSEWRAYAEWFYGYSKRTGYGDTSKWVAASWYEAKPLPERYGASSVLSKEQIRVRKERFDRAWLLHQHRNPHHWQFYVLLEDSGAEKVLPIPDRYRREMVADWKGAGRAIHGKDETKEWYLKTKAGRKLHPETQAWVEAQLGLA